MNGNVKIRVAAGAALCLLAWAGLVREAAAVYVFGGCPALASSVRPVRWALSYMDTNHDGDVSGPNEGIPITFESGPYGWTANEMNVLRECFAVWENVATSYIQFWYTDPIPDPLENVGGLFTGPYVVDGINLVALDVPGELTYLDLAGSGIIGITMIDALIEDDILFRADYPNLSFPASGGQILECDIVIAEPLVRPLMPGMEPFFDMKGTVVHEIGHLLGLAHTPTYNVAEDPNMPNWWVGLSEDPVLAMRNAANVLELVGATPTMFPFPFDVRNPNGTYTNGERDLAPSDVSSLSFLYPRGSQNHLFNIMHEARGQERPGIPTFPILGGIVTAWCDVDNNASTRRVPLFTTLTGYWRHNSELLRMGTFDLRGLPKQLEDMNGVTFPASYTLSIHWWFNDPMWMQSYGVDLFDSFHGLRPVDAWSHDYDALFPSEVFREGGNLFGLDNYDRGTPLVFDSSRNRVVSVFSGKTLETMLPGRWPMFGDPDMVCPLNIIVSSVHMGGKPTVLHKIRDYALLHSTVGTALVDTYYRLSPSLTRFLLCHAVALKTACGMARGVVWACTHYRMLLIFAVTAMLVRWLLQRRRRLAQAAAAALVLGISLGWFAAPAEALLQRLTEDQRVALADDIVEGTIAAVESRWLVSQSSRQQWMVTDVTVTVTDRIKGRLNKNGEIHVRMPGGRIGEEIVWTEDMPSFRVGERAILYLKNSPKFGYVLVSGVLGKEAIVRKADTGEDVVLERTRAAPKAAQNTQQDNRPENQAEPGAKAPKTGSGETQDKTPWVSLEARKKHLREIVKRQEEAKREE